MTDTLRARIAAAMWAELQRQSQEKPKEALYVADADARYENGEVGLIDGHVNVSHVADAVIRELNLDISHYYKTSQGREVCVEGFWTEEGTDGTA